MFHYDPWPFLRAFVPVVTVPAPADDPQQGALVVLATDRVQALALASTTAPLSLTIAPTTPS